MKLGTCGYDNDGRQTVMYDGSGGSGWQYDWADNVTQLVTPQGTMDYVYDQWNRQTKLTEGTIETNYSFTNEKLSLITKSSDGVATALGYDNYGRLTEKNDGATRTIYGYDTNDRVNSIVHSKTVGGQTLHQESYNYDPANNLNWKLVNSVLTSYTYDSIDQLKTENSSSLSNTYNYDNNGNRTSRISNAGTDTYTYDYGDKLTGITRSYGASSTYTYDYCGRTSTIAGPGGTRIFNWDFEDRLTSISGGGVPSTTYGYNGVGSRVSKSNTQGTRTYKRNGVGVTAPVLSDGVATMVPGISEKSGGVTSTILSDRMGSMKGMANAGTVTETAEFDAFGKVIARTNPSATQKGFAGGFGYQEDGETGYKLLGHRYYDADTGRFLSRDRAFAGRNWYDYVGNSPLRYADPTGEVRIDIAGGAAVLKGTDVAGALAVRPLVVPQFLKTIAAMGAAIGGYLSFLLPDSDRTSDRDKESERDKGRKKKKEEGPMVYRVAGKEEAAATAANGGRPVPSPSYENEKPFWANAESAMAYQQLAARGFGDTETVILAFPNPFNVGRKGINMDGFPTIMVPNPDLNKLGPAFTFPTKI